MSSDLVDAYIASKPAPFAMVLQDLRLAITGMLPDHPEVMSYAMPGFRQPGSKGKMVIGYAAFTHHIGVYPHSGRIIARLDCLGVQSSKSGILFPPVPPLPLALIAKIITLRQAEIAGEI